MKEGLDRRSLGRFEGNDIRPFREKIQSQRAVQRLAYQLQGLRIITFEQAAHRVGKAGAPINAFAPQFAQARQLASGGVLNNKRAQLVHVILQEVQQEEGVWSIVLGARRAERLAVARAGGWVNGENRQPRDIKEHMYERPLAGFQRDGDGFAVKTIFDILEPGFDTLSGLEQC